MKKPSNLSALSIILFLIILPVTLRGNPTDVPVWTPIVVKKGSTHLFVAMQEAEFVRVHLGEWIPKSFYEISDKHELLYRIEAFTKVDLEIQIKISIWDVTADVKGSVAWHWTLPKDTAEKDIRVITREAGMIEVRNLDSGEIRRIVLTPLSNAQEAQKTFSISRSAPL